MKRMSDERAATLADRGWIDDSNREIADEMVRARASEARLLDAMRAVELHLMVRPKQRLPETEHGVRAMARDAIEAAENGTK